MKRWVISLFLLLVCSITTKAGSPELISVITAESGGTRFGQRIVALGDQNHDGFDDFLTWDLHFRAYIYFGGNPFDSLYDLRIDSVGSRIDAFDINGDNDLDLVIPGTSKDQYKAGIYYGGILIDTVRDGVLGNDTLIGYGFSVWTNDINQNGSPEIFSFSTIQNSIVMFEMGISQDSIPDLQITPPNLDRGDYNTFGFGIMSGDFNGDGIDDLGTSIQYRGVDSLKGQILLYFGGADFDTIPDLILSRPGEYFLGTEYFGRLLHNLHDINGDGYDDFVASSQIAYDDTIPYIYFGGPDLDVIPDLVLSERVSMIRSAGDINNDGFIDFISSYPMEFMNFGYINIHLGGPDVDSIPDFTIHNSGFDGSPQYFGRDLSGIGDVNGDGIDDFAFSAEPTIDYYLQGTVYIYSGWDDNGTDVNYEYEPKLPSDFLLYQNYPNPFNPSTTITFEIPIKSAVSLTIYNVLGQKIRTLIKNDLSAGSYTLQWDGKDQLGNLVASGIYIYKLESDQISISKKMMLLK